MGDSGLAGDITSVEVGNDNTGRITFRVALANRPEPDKHESVTVYLQTDFRRETGWYGLDYKLTYAGGSGKAALARWEPSRWVAVEGADVRWSYEGGPRMTIRRADLGDIWAFRFSVRAARPGARAVDDYPGEPGTGPRYDIRIPLSLEGSSVAPKRPRLAGKIVARMVLLADPAVARRPTVRCTATLAAKRVRGVPTLTLAPPVEAAERRRVDATCTWRATRRGLFRGRIAVALADMVESRDISLRVR